MYSWRRFEPLGFVVTDVGGAIGGVLQVIYSPPRPFGGEWRVAANPGTLFILPECRSERDRERRTVRRIADEITHHAMEGPHVCVSWSAHGPNDVVARMLDERLGWERISEALIFTPVAFSRPFRRTLEDLSREGQQLVADHTEYGCQACVVEGCLVISKRTTYKDEAVFRRFAHGRRVPVTEILHLSAPERLESIWGRVVATLCLHDRTIGVVCTESFFGGWKPDGRRIPQTLRVYNRGSLPTTSIDKLYSEAVLFPR